MSRLERGDRFATCRPGRFQTCPHVLKPLLRCRPRAGGETSYGFFRAKWSYTSFATFAHSRFPALSVRNVLSSFWADITHSATGPVGVQMIPPSVRASLVVPVLWATTVFAGRKRGNLSRSSHFLRCSSISLLASGL